MRVRSAESEDTEPKMALLCEMRIVGSTRSCVCLRNLEARTEPVRRNVAHLGRACLTKPPCFSWRSSHPCTRGLTICASSSSFLSLRKCSLQLRIVPLTAFPALSLIAGLKFTKYLPFLSFDNLGRKVNPRKSNRSCSYEPLRFPSLQ